MPTDMTTAELGQRIEELNVKCTQILMFLSFATAAAVLLWSHRPSRAAIICIGWGAVDFVLGI
jgi:hypothetical protein